MKLLGPERYELRFDSHRFELLSVTRDGKLSNRVRTRGPKLYVIAKRGRIVYVGITNQPVPARLRIGWTADGRSGYYGYAFRHHLRSASLHVWFHPRPGGKKAIRELETVEAEVAYAVRRSGQWPRFQTEIHFYPSRAVHRRVARDIVAYVRRAR